MKANAIPIVLLSAALLGTLGLCGLTTFGAYNYAKEKRITLIRDETIKAEVTEERSFSVNGPVVLEVDTELGDISVTAGSEKQVLVMATRVGRGETQAEAESEAHALPVEMLQDGGRISLRFVVPEQRRVVLFGSDHQPLVHFQVSVPVQADVTLKTRNGEIQLRGTHGQAALENTFGDATIEDLQGPASVKTNNGGVTLRRVQAGPGSLTLSSSFGATVLEDISAAAIELSSGNGSVNLKRVTTTGGLTVHNNFAAVDLQDVQAGTLDVTNENGAIQVQGGKISGDLKLTGSFGRVKVQGLDAASYTITNNNGEILLDGARGRLDLSTDFGGITVKNAANAALKIKVQNGAAHFSGSLDPKAAHTVETSFGDIELSLPASSVLNLDLTTDFGKIQSDLPVQLAGEMSETHWLGSLNGGGAKLTASADNGSIHLMELK